MLGEVGVGEGWGLGVLVHQRDRKVEWQRREWREEGFGENGDLAMQKWQKGQGIIVPPAAPSAVIHRHRSAYCAHQISNIIGSS